MENKRRTMLVLMGTAIMSACVSLPRLKEEYLGSIRFDSGESTVSDNSEYTIARTAKKIVEIRDDNAVVIIRGHTDVSGDPVSNKRLSEARVEAVRSRLLRYEIDKEIMLYGLGSQESMGGISQDEKARSRRVDIFIEYSSKY